EAGAGRAGAARHAHQPHLRRFDRDHAPADRARGGRPAPAGGGRRARRRDAAGREGQERRRGRRVLRPLAAEAGGRRGPQAELGELATHLRYAGRASRRLARSTFYAMTRWQAKLEQRQSFLGRIVDVGAELFAISAAVVYAQTVAAEQPERAESARELAGLFCRQARRRSDRLFHELWANDDTEGYAAALAVLDGRHRWIEEGVADPAGD